MFIDHAELGADKNIEPVFYDTFAFDHLDYDILSNTPHKEYLNNVYRLGPGGFNDIKCSGELFYIYEMRQRKNWEGADSVYDVGFYETIRQENGFPTKSLYVCSQNGKHKGSLYTTKRIWKSVRNQHQ